MKRLEQQSDGSFVARYGFQRHEDGRVTFTQSKYATKPTVEQIARSLRRFAMSCAMPSVDTTGPAADDATEPRRTLNAVAYEPDRLSDYMTY